MPQKKAPVATPAVNAEELNQSSNKMTAQEQAAATEEVEQVTLEDFQELIQSKKVKDVQPAKEGSEEASEEVERIDMAQIEGIMRAYRDLSSEDKASAFKYLLKEMPREHMLAQLSLLGMPDENREELSKAYEEHLKTLKETNEEWAQEAAIVAKTLLTLHSVARKKEGLEDEDGEEKEDKLPPLWKRVIIIPACFLLVGLGLVLKNYIEDTYIFGAVMAVIIFGCGGYLMKFLGDDDEEDAAKIEDLIQKEMMRRELMEQDNENEGAAAPEPKKDK